MHSTVARSLACALLVGACTATQSVPPSNGGPPVPSAGSPAPSEASPQPSASPALSPSADPAIVAGTLPVPGSIGSTVQLAPGPNGSLYLVVVAPLGGDFGPPAHSIVAVLDAGGRPRPGWPIDLVGWTCDTPSPGTPSWSPVVADDGSVRVVCHSVGDPAADDLAYRAFAFDSHGDALAGWPVDLPGDVWAESRLVDGRLLVVAHETGEPDPATSTYPVAFWIMSIGTDGGLVTGARHEVIDGGWLGEPVLGPDGVAYLQSWDGQAEIRAFDLAGPRSGWPVRIDGTPSALGFGPQDHVYLTEGAADGLTSRTRVVGPGGQVVAIGSSDLPVQALAAFTGAGPGGRPAPPTVAADGSTFVLSAWDTAAGGGWSAYALDPSGDVLAGWPYQAAGGMQWRGTCGSQDVGCGVWRATPAVGPDDTLYVPVGATVAAGGGGLVAIGLDGQLVDGWPVTLSRRGAGFWSVVVGADGIVFAVAVEPAGDDLGSATVLAVAPDSSIGYRTTVVEP